MITVSVPGQINWKTVTVIIRKSQSGAHYFGGIRHIVCFFIKLNLLVPKEDIIIVAV